MSSAPTDESEDSTVDAPIPMRPRRDPVAKELDRAKVWAGLFDTPMPSIGRFEVLSRIGAGGMADVYVAYDPKVCRKVAIKLLRASIAGAADNEPRLLREARTMARLSHPNVAHVYEVGEYRDRVFIAMEFIEGKNMRAWLTEQARQHTGIAYRRSVLDRFQLAGRGLQASHEAGVVHRDFKPENVLIGDDGRLRVADFGLARASTSEQSDGAQAFPSSDTASSGLTRASGLAGTPLYMAPEQLHGQVVDHRADQYSFCVALYEALFQTKPAEARLAGQRQSIPRGHAVTIPRSHRKALLRGLSPDPDKRFADMDALLRALERGSGYGLLFGLAAIVAGFFILGLLFNSRPPSSNPCADTEQALEALWNPEREATIARAFASTGHPDARIVWPGATQALDRYVDDWYSASLSMCKAVHEPPALSSEMADRSAICLAEGRERLASLLNRLQNADRRVVAETADAIARLPAVGPCADLKLLRDGQRAPTRSEWAAVSNIRAALAAAHTMELFGDYEQALLQARRQLAEAEQLSYRPVEARALHLVGRLTMRDDSSKSSREGQTLLEKARQIADGERALVLKADTWASQMHIGARYRRPVARMRAWSEDALTASHAVGDPPRTKAEILRHLGVAEHNAENYVLAEQLLREGLALLDTEASTPVVVRARHLHDLGNAVLAQARKSKVKMRIDEARDLYQQALDGYRSTRGEHHRDVLDLRFDMAMRALEQGEHDNARTTLNDMVARYRANRGATDPHLGRALLELAKLDYFDGQFVRGEKRATEALSIYLASYDPDDSKLAFAHDRLAAFALARADYEKAVSEYQATLAIENKHSGPESEAAAFARLNLAGALLGLKRHDEALEHVTLAEQNLADIIAGGDPVVLGFLAALRGRALFGKGDLALSRPLLTAAVAQLNSVSGMERERADAAWALARCTSSNGQGADGPAIAQARIALAIYENIEAATPKAEVSRWLRAARQP